MANYAKVDFLWLEWTKERKWKSSITTLSSRLDDDECSVHDVDDDNGDDDADIDDDDDDGGGDGDDGDEFQRIAESISYCTRYRQSEWNDGWMDVWMDEPGRW